MCPSQVNVFIELIEKQQMFTKVLYKYDIYNQIKIQVYF